MILAACIGEEDRESCAGVIAGHPEMRHLIEFLPAEMARLSTVGLGSNLIPSLAELL